MSSKARLFKGLARRANHPLECASEEAPAETYVATSDSSPVASPVKTTLLDEATMDEMFASSLENANSTPVRLSRAERREREKLKRAAERRAAQSKGKAKLKAGR